MKFLAVILGSTMLVGCGSGGGGSDSPAPPTTGLPSPGPSLASPTLAKYEGVWREDCVDHRRFTKTFKATGSTTFSVATQEDFFDNADCTGALVATGGYGPLPDENVQYAAPLPNASVTLLTGVDITTPDVDPATSVYAAGATFTITGSVKSTEVDTTVFARVEYATGTPRMQSSRAQR